MPNLRTGKIARLPFEIRTELNRRLQNGSSLPRLVVWLNTLPEVRATMREYFHSRPILRQNLSQWTQGGYQDWLHQQSPNDLSHCLSEDTTAFTKEHPPLTDTLNHWSATRLALRTRRINALYEKDPEAADKLLTQMIRDLTTLQHSQTRARREQRQRDQLTYKEEQSREKTEADHQRWLLHPANHDRLDALWKKAYPEDYFADEEDTDDSHQDENSKQDHDPQSKKHHPAQPAENSEDDDDPLGASSRPNRPPPPQKHYDVNGNPIRNPPPRSAPGPTAGTKNAVTLSEVESRAERDDCASSPEGEPKRRVNPHPSARTSPASPQDHPTESSPTSPPRSSSPKPPRPPCPSDAARETVARTLCPKGFAKHGLAVFDHLPLPDPSGFGRPVHPG